MIENAEANQIKNDYLDTLKSLIDRIQIKAKDEHIEVDNGISIYIGTSKVYEGVKGEKPTKNSLTPEVVENIQKAIADPQNTKSSITIKIGKQEVFKVRNGKLINDKLKLSSAPVQKAAPKERTYSIGELQKQVEVLKNKINEQEKTIAQLSEQPQTKETLEKLTKEVEQMAESLAKQQKLIEATQKSLSEISPIKTQNSKLQNWVGSVENKVKQISNSILEAAQNKLTEVRTQIDDSVRQIKGKMIESAVKVLLDKLGERNPDGSLSFRSNNFDFKQDGDNVTVKAKDGTNVLKNGVVAKELPVAVEQEIKVLPEKVFEFIDQLDQQENLVEKQPSLSR
ncbi:hypothetical protein LC593_30110 [Nostoc sp. CHAB 5844]|nr:hypothetical protein [Nostoc sp. CHAB 5844]